MKNFAILSVIFILQSCNNEERQINNTFINGKVKNEWVFPDKNDRKNWKIIEYYQNGKISFEGYVFDFKFIKEKRNYYENGNLKSIDSLSDTCDFNDCCCNGKVSQFYSNGKLKKTFELKNGTANGLVTFYNEDSTGILEENYMYKNDKKEGKAISFYKSGKMFSMRTYKNDKLIDYVYRFKENGDTISIFYTWNGNIDFPAKKWLENGEVFYANYLNNTTKKAEFKWTDKNGKILRKEVVKPNKEGKWIIPN